MSLFDSNILDAANAPISDRTMGLIANAMADGATADEIREASAALAAENVTSPAWCARSSPTRLPPTTTVAGPSPATASSSSGTSPGLGKTQVAQAHISDAVAQGGYAIVIAPPVAKLGWMTDLAASFPHLRFHHCFGTKPDLDALPEADIYFLNDHTQSMKAWLVTTEIVKSDGREVPVFTPTRSPLARASWSATRSTVTRASRVTPARAATAACSPSPRLCGPLASPSSR